MHDYVVSLHKVFKKNICPWATYMEVEMAVYMYIQNLCHKAESIFMDQFELKILNHDIQEEEDQNNTIGFGKEDAKNNGGKQKMTEINRKGDKGRNNLQGQDQDQDDQENESNSTFTSKRILKRLMRIYGKEHESVKQFMHRNDKSSLPFGNLGMNNMMNMNMNMNMNLLKMGGNQEKDAAVEDGNPKSQIQEPGPQSSSIIRGGALGLNNLGNLMPIGSAE